MVGAEAHAGGPHARGQYHPATIHWRLPDGTVGWLRLVHHGPTTAAATARRLTVECHPHRRHGPQPLVWESNVEPVALTLAHWSFPGLELAVATNSPALEPSPLTQRPAAAESTTTVLTVT